MDRSCRTDRDAFPAQFAFVKMNVGQIIFHRDRIEGALFDAFAASDAGDRAGFACRGLFVFIDAADKNPSVFRPFFTKFDNMLWACDHAFAAGSAFDFINDRKPGHVIHMDCIKRAGAHAICQA